jgi:hypothetical protein
LLVLDVKTVSAARFPKSQFPFPEIPVLGQKFAVLGLFAPCYFVQGIVQESPVRQGFMTRCLRQKAPNLQNTLFFSLFAGNWAGDRRDQHCRPSQPLLCAENVGVISRESPPMAGFCYS